MSETAHEFDSNKKQRKNAKFKVDNKKPAMLNHWFSHLCHAGYLNEREVWLQKSNLVNRIVASTNSCYYSENQIFTVSNSNTPIFFRNKTFFCGPNYLKFCED